jgi:hypothetical protein
MPLDYIYGQQRPTIVGAVNCTSAYVLAASVKATEVSSSEDTEIHLDEGSDVVRKCILLAHMEVRTRDQGNFTACFQHMQVEDILTNHMRDNTATVVTKFVLFNLQQPSNIPGLRRNQM